MKRQAFARWTRWLPLPLVLLLSAVCILVFKAWLARANLAQWLQLFAFCS